MWCGHTIHVRLHLFAVLCHNVGLRCLYFSLSVPLFSHISTSPGLCISIQPYCHSPPVHQVSSDSHHHGHLTLTSTCSPVCHFPITLPAHIPDPVLQFVSVVSCLCFAATWTFISTCDLMNLHFFYKSLSCLDCHYIWQWIKCFGFGLLVEHQRQFQEVTLGSWGSCWAIFDYFYI